MSAGPRPASNPSREKQRLELRCPGLIGKPYRVTSEATRLYNCFAWAAGDYRRFWSPLRGSYYWPSELAREDPTSVETVRAYFERRGFQEQPADVDDRQVEQVAIYGDAKGCLHVARRPPGGKWLSKMGDGADIEHADLRWIECLWVGTVQCVLGRRPGAADAPRGR